MQTRRCRDVGHPDGPLVVCSHEGGHAFGTLCPSGGRHVRFRMKGMAWLTSGGPVPGQSQQPRLQFEQNDAPRPSGLELPRQRLVQQVCSAFKARRVGRIGVGLRDGASSQSRLNQLGRKAPGQHLLKRQGEPGHPGVGGGGHQSVRRGGPQERLTAVDQTSQTQASDTQASDPLDRERSPWISPHHLSDEQIRFFDEQGYLILRNWVTGELLSRLQAAGTHWIERGLADGGANRDHLFAEREVGRVIWRVDYVHDKGGPTSLELLGSPQVLGVAQSLCGPNFVSTYESMVFKFEGNGEKIPWHQDAVDPRNWRIFNFDLYFDEPRAGSGAL